MRRVWLVGVWVLFVALSVAGAASAAPLGIYAKAGYNMIAPEAINEQIDAANIGYDVLVQLARDNGYQATYKKMKNLNGGLAIAGGVFSPVSDVLSVQAGLDYFTNGSEGTFQGADPVDPTRDTTIKPRIGVTYLGFTGGGEFEVIQSDSLRIAAVGGVGYYNITVAAGYTEEPEGASKIDDVTEWKAASIGFNVGANAIYDFNPNLGLEVGVGYRSLNTDELIDDDGNTMRNGDGSPTEVGLSGVTLRSGIVYTF